MTDWISLDQLVCRPIPGRILGIGADAQVLEHADFFRQVQSWRSAFAAEQGRNWALYFEDTLSFAAALFGAWQAGKRVFLATDTSPAMLAALRQEVDGFAGDFEAGCSPLAPMQDIDLDALPRLDERSCELVVFTSGSTGTPLAIVKRLDQLAREVEAHEQIFGHLLANARIHGTVSHQHIYGLLFRVLSPLAAGRCIEPRRFFHEELFQALGSGPSILVATPAYLQRLPEPSGQRPPDGPVRMVFSSGGVLSEETAARVRRVFGVAATEIYGSSETGGIAWRRREAGSSAWQPLPEVRWRIEEECLGVASPHLPTSAWMRTTDRVQALPDGEFQLLGRVDRIVKVAERRVSLNALERDLCAAPGVVEARALLLPGRREYLAAVLVPADKSVIGADRHQCRKFSRQVVRYLSDRHDAGALPRRWRWVPALPMNAQGKVTQALLEREFQPLRPTPVWLQRASETARLSILLDPALRVFDGHFPQAKILPGVAQIDWAIRFGRMQFPVPPIFLRMEQIKFQQVARPGDLLSLTLDWDVERKALSFRYTSDAGTHASGKVVFADAV